MANIKFALCVLSLVFSGSALASTYLTPVSLKHVEISAAVGPNWTHASNTHLVISPYETDSVLVNRVSNSVIWKIGAGYHFFEEQLKQRNFFNDLLLELNIYRSSETVRGNVWQYQLSQFNNYSFRAPITSTRLMLDFKPGLLTWNHISPYPILGLGVAWNDIAYRENVTGAGADPDSYHSLGSHTSSHFAYDLGAGVRMDIAAHLTASLEYLYTNLGKMAPNGTPSNDVALTSPPTFTIYSQSVLLGLSWKFD